MAKSERTFDPRSEVVVLEYQGHPAVVDDESGAETKPAWEPALGGIPARDLTEADISRLVYAAAVNEYDGTPNGPPMPDPLKPSQAKARGLVELLLGREVDGRAVYRLAKATKAEAAAAKSSTDSHTPAEPAEPEA